MTVFSGRGGYQLVTLIIIIIGHQHSIRVRITLHWRRPELHLWQHLSLRSLWDLNGFIDFIENFLTCFFDFKGNFLLNTFQLTNHFLLSLDGILWMSQLLKVFLFVITGLPKFALKWMFFHFHWTNPLTHFLLKLTFLLRLFFPQC